MNIEQWLESIGLDKYVEILAAEEVGIDDLPHLTDADLEGLGIPLGPRRRILASIPDPTLHPRQDSPRIGQAERRTMTVVFCDLVGSTELSGRLDPEDLQLVMEQYQTAVTHVFDGYRGHVARFIGDGVLVYFGWPRAHEDQVSNAVRAGIEVVAAVAEIPALELGTNLAARVGMATGPVVVGELLGDSSGVIGETPNLAARLEGLAGPGQVVMDAETAQLVARSVKTESLGPHDLKGISRTIEVFRAVGPLSNWDERFDSIPETDLSPFLGRSTELSLLRSAWGQAQEQGVAVLVIGEPGIGKSRLIREFLTTRGVEDARVLRLQCSAIHGATMLYPVFSHLRTVRNGGSDPPSTGELDVLLRDTDDTPTLWLTCLLEGRELPKGVDPEAGRQALLERLHEYLIGGQNMTTVLVVEDLQWADPTTLRLMREIVTSITRAPTLLIGTARPGWNTAPISGALVTTLGLGGLPVDDLAEIAQVSSSRGLSDDEARALVAKAAGNPLYAEELARSADAGSNAELPSSLEASIAARLDQLSGAKAVAQAAAVLDQPSGAELLASVLGDHESQVRGSLDRLVDHGIMVQTGEEYAFRHRIVRDVAYGLLIRVDRHLLHRRAARALGEEGGSEAEVVAGHLLAANEWPRALEELGRAAAEAQARAAWEEAIAFMERGLEATTRLPEGQDRRRAELALLLDIAPAVMTIRGYASRTAEELYERARAVAEELEDHDRQFVATWGSYYIKEIRADWTSSRPDVERLLDIDRSQLRPDLPIQIDHAAATFFGAQGDALKSAEFARRVVVAYSVDLHDRHRFRFGAHDPGVCGYNQLALMSAQLGSIEEGLGARRDSETLAAALDHPPTIVQSSWFGSLFVSITGDLESERSSILSSIELAGRHGVGPIRRNLELQYLAIAPDRAAAFDELGGWVRRTADRGRTGFMVPLILRRYAQMAIDLSDLDSARMALDLAERFAAYSGERSDIPLLLATRARVLIAEGDEAAAIRAFEEAHDVADALHRRLDRLTVSTELADLLAAKDAAKARALLEAGLAPFRGQPATHRVSRGAEVLSALS